MCLYATGFGAPAAGAWLLAIVQDLPVLSSVLYCNVDATSSRSRALLQGALTPPDHPLSAQDSRRTRTGVASVLPDLREWLPRAGRAGGGATQGPRRSARARNSPSLPAPSSSGSLPTDAQHQMRSAPSAAPSTASPGSQARSDGGALDTQTRRWRKKDRPACYPGDHAARPRPPAAAAPVAASAAATVDKAAGATTATAAASITTAAAAAVDTVKAAATPTAAKADAAATAKVAPPPAPQALPPLTVPSQSYMEAWQRRQRGGQQQASPPPGCSAAGAGVHTTPPPAVPLPSLSAVAAVERPPQPVPQRSPRCWAQVVATQPLHRSPLLPPTPPVLATAHIRIPVPVPGGGSEAHAAAGDRDKMRDWEDEADDFGGKCLVCMDAPRQLAFQHLDGSLHAGVCRGCEAGLRARGLAASCPMCRQEVRQLQPLEPCCLR
ncbi:hypothetical protein TSOC_006409 [Tetrabaena socialis]|uniref:RING-type domain-containing protein n=1 Tax=Tetrabaena socialis TaxID=47790 RepID=A0A2J8A3R4_9CHLO|nr:hypothetical protein TSOC_006409 [Tetrabaena socialis]|eukprot:PNH07146.1 hypothetical protein TSOC_006409 [Tetrabaena socialis]